jgi:hypothetical protein
MTDSEINKKIRIENTPEEKKSWCDNCNIAPKIQEHCINPLFT